MATAGSAGRGPPYTPPLSPKPKKFIPTPFAFPYNAKHLPSKKGLSGTAGNERESGGLWLGFGIRTLCMVTVGGAYLLVFEKTGQAIPAISTDPPGVVPHSDAGDQR